MRFGASRRPITEQEERRFAASLAFADSTPPLTTAVGDHLIAGVPPRILAELRHDLSGEAKARLRTKSTRPHAAHHRRYRDSIPLAAG